MQFDNFIPEDEMKVLFSNRYMDALIKTIFFFGITHLAILAYIAMHEDIHVLNAFKILNLDFFMPGLGSGIVNFILSYCMVLCVYCPVFFILTKPAKTNS